MINNVLEFQLKIGQYLECLEKKSQEEEGKGAIASRVGCLGVQQNPEHGH